jgi:DNA-3-methyladenine glycosylase I
MLAYHDEEWGRPSRDDRHLFEHLVLEGAQAGLSWRTILYRREGYRRCFADFDAEAVARFGERQITRLLRDPGIIRNQAKIRSAVNNAQRVLEVRTEFGSFARYLWAFVDDRPIVTRRRRLRDLPVQTPLSRKLSEDLARRGFTFVGPVGTYAFMQAVGMVNDHLVSCPRHPQYGR